MPAMGVEWDGPARQPCPQCDRGARDRALGVTVEADGAGVAHCFRCDYVETRRGEVRHGAPRMPAVALAKAVVTENKIERASAILAATRAIATEPQSPAAQYLVQTRCCAPPPADADLRWHQDLRLFEFSGPALVGRMSLATDHRAFRGLHITWLRYDGTQWQRTERRYLGPKAGCVVRLWPDEAVTTGLAVAEGVETALSLAHGFAPVWACVDAGNLSAFPVLSGIESLTIAADNDPAGLQATAACAKRWHQAGRAVYIVKPPRLGADLNDLAREAA